MSAFDKVHIKEVIEETVVKDKFVHVVFNGKYYGQKYKFESTFSKEIWDKAKKDGYVFMNVVGSRICSL